MPAVSNPNRSPVFRLITIASSGLGSFILGLWGLQFGFGDGVAGLPAEVVGSVIAALCALAAGGAAMSFFAGVDKSVSYVVKETHFDKLTGPALAAGHDRQDRRGGAIHDQDRRAGLPHRHRHRPFQADQRIDRLQQGRRTGSCIRPAAQGEPPRKCRHRPHRRRRIRRSLSGRLFQHVDGRHRRTADRRADGAVRSADPSAVGQRVGRHRRHAEGWRRSRPAAQALEPGASECPRRRHRQLGGVPPRNRQGRGLSAMDRGGTQRRLRARRFRSALSAADRPAEGQDRRLRGADPLEASRTRHDPADGVHPDRRGDRHDRADRRMGAAQGLQRCALPARRLLRRGEHLGRAVHDQGFRRPGRRCRSAKPASSRRGWNSS